jgi:hypothetical protein
MCLVASEAAYPGEEVYELVMRGREMSADEKASLEEQVAKNPSDVTSRTKLLGYYFGKSRRDADAKPAQRRHVLWLIENAPESEVLGLPHSNLDRILDPAGYAQAEQAWLKVLQKSPENLSVLWNASKFFLLQDREKSEELLLKGQALDVKNPRWPATLGQLYLLELQSLQVEPMKKKTAEKAFRQFVLAFDRSDKEGQDSLLDSMAKAALAAGLVNDAKEIATTMLKDDSAGWNQGNRIHHGNLILGRIALAEGNLDEAKSRLLLAGKTNGSPQLNSFGPNVLLAKELLERGETEVVLEYFELCKKFWASPFQKLDQWIKDVKSDQVPDFGANLVY